MIKANELRIGNRLLYHINEDGIEWEVCTVDWHDLKWISQDQEGFNKKHKPIPLTEEVLKAWGFESNKEFMYTKNFNAVELYNECIEFFFEPNEEVCITLRQMESDNHNEMSHVFIRKIMYLHNLQNLYFALTGDELKPINN